MQKRRLNPEKDPYPPPEEMKKIMEREAEGIKQERELRLQREQERQKQNEENSFPEEERNLTEEESLKIWDKVIRLKAKEEEKRNEETWEPVKKWDSFKLLPVFESDPVIDDPLGGIKNLCRRKYNEAQKLLQENPQDFSAWSYREAVSDILAYIELVRRGDL
jgi:hypothetical protein